MLFQRGQTRICLVVVLYGLVILFFVIVAETAVVVKVVGVHFVLLH